MLNHVALLGRLAQEPELKMTQKGTSVTNFDLAVTVPSKEQNKAPDFIPVVCWGNTAEFVSKYLAKGRQIVVEGRLSTRKYTDNDGKNRKVVEVVASNIYFADSGNREGDNGNSQQVPDVAPAYQIPDPAPAFEELKPDEDLPF